MPNGTPTDPPDRDLPAGDSPRDGGQQPWRRGDSPFPSPSGTPARGQPGRRIPPPPSQPPLPKSPRAPRPDAATPKVTAATQVRLQALLAERASRRVEGLKLYEPLPPQLAFHQSTSRIRIVRGGNRSGKTLAAAAEVARAVTGTDPFGKYKEVTDGRCFCVGRDLDHIGEVMWRKLARAGQFKMVRDQGSGLWRAFRPWSAADRGRAHEARGAPPLIPPRLIKEISWENKRAGIPALVRLTNGWEISFYSSLGTPPAGSDISLVWLDEEVVCQEWLPEMQARVIDRGGCILWSATPQAGTEQLYDLHEQAARCRFDPAPDVQEFLTVMADNPHIGEEEKRAFAAGLSEDEALVRVQGEFAVMTYRVYPEFSMLRHGLDWREIPAGWTRYLAVDPGHRVAAVLFAAVPPPDLLDPALGPQSLVLYDELYLREANAQSFAEALRQKTLGQQIYCMLVDPNMAVITDVGGGRSVGEQYAEALAAVGVRSVLSGPSLLPGSDDVASGILAVKSLLRARADGPPRLRVLRGALPNFEYEIARYHHKRVRGVVSDQPEQRQASHLLDCFRYLALLGPKWVRPRPALTRPKGARKAYLDKRKRRREETGGPFIRLGPGGGRRQS